MINLELQQTILKDCFILKPHIFEDERGFFSETYNKQTFKEATSLNIDFVQDNQSVSTYGVLRGLHFQRGPMAQSKLVRVVKGKVLDIIVDIRKNSETFGKHISVILDDVEQKQLFVPRGFAHGFLTLSDSATVFYKCDNHHKKEAEGGIVYRDIDLGIEWKINSKNLLLSDKDQKAPTLKNYLETGQFYQNYSKK